MESKFFMGGAAVPRRDPAAVERRAEVRQPVTSGTAVLELRGRRHLVRVVNVSNSGAMVIFPHSPNLGPDIGERLVLQLLDRGVVSSQVRWVKDGRIGLTFELPPG